ncbi:MAG: hypothetical protein WB998_05040, partial [Solirubrobacteraceae bacterium]
MHHEPLVTLPAVLRGSPAGQSNGDGRSSVRYLMGVDGGATKTLAAVLDLQERHVHLGHGASSNPDAVGSHAATDSLVKA